jgi:hypothetical protein
MAGGGAPCYETEERWGRLEEEEGANRWAQPVGDRVRERSGAGFWAVWAGRIGPRRGWWVGLAGKVR